MCAWVSALPPSFHLLIFLWAITPVSQPLCPSRPGAVVALLYDGLLTPQAGQRASILELLFPGGEALFWLDLQLGGC